MKCSHLTKTIAGCFVALAVLCTAGASDARAAEPPECQTIADIVNGAAEANADVAGLENILLDEARAASFVRVFNAWPAVATVDADEAVIFTLPASKKALVYFFKAGFACDRPKVLHTNQVDVMYALARAFEHCGGSPP